MTFIDPPIPDIPTPVSPSRPLFGPDIQQPVVPRLPEHQSSFLSKWQELSPLLESDPRFNAQGINAVYGLDRERLVRGQRPLTRQQTTRAALAASTRRTVTAEPDRDWWNVPGNFVRDLRNMVTAIPQIPMALVEEVRELPSAPQHISQAFARGDLGGVLEAPGVRFLPGAYVGANLLRGDWRQVLETPLMSALDVAPVTKQLGVNQAVRRAVARTPVGRAASAVKSTIADSRAGVAVRSRVGGDARALGRIVGTLEAQIGDAVRESTGAVPPALRSTEFRRSLTNIVREARQLAEKFPEAQDGAWRQRVTQVAKLGDPDSLASLTEREAAFVQATRELNERIASTVSAATGEFVSYGGEWYTADVGNRLWAMQGRARRARELAGISRAMSDVRFGPLDDTALRRVDTLVGEIRATLDRDTAAAPRRPGDKTRAVRADESRTGALSKREKQTRIRGLLHALDMQGVDVSDLQTVLRRSRDLDDFRVALDAWTPNPRPLVNPADMLAVVNKYGRNWTRAGELKQALRSGNWREARRIAKAIGANRKATIPEVADWYDTLERLAARDIRFGRDFARHTDVAANRAERVLERARAENAPARFGDLIEREADKTLTQRALSKHAATVGVVDDATRDRITQAILDRRYRDAGLSEAEVIQHRVEIARTWERLKAAGYDPVFVHRVPEHKIGQLLAPKLSEIGYTPSATRVRTIDSTPYIDDLTVAIPHEGMEFLQRELAEDIISEVRSRWGITAEDAYNQFRDEAQYLASVDRRFSFQQHLDRLVNKHYTSFNPETFGYNWPSKRLSQLTESQWFIPKHVADALLQYHNPKYSKLAVAIEPAMKVFRTALLPLSPRWHVNNIIGGGIMVSAETSPLAFRHVGVIRQFLRGADDVIPDWMRDELNVLKGGDRRAFAEANYYTGRTLGRLQMEAMQSRLGRAARRVVGEGSIGQRIVDKSFDFNEWVDNLFRGSAAMEAYEKAIKRGADESVARSVAIESMRRVLPDWTAMTAFERGVLRQIFPFYNFVGWLIRRVWNYPADHPVRTAILGSITRAELDDLDGLPDRFLGMFFWGKEDPVTGARNAIQVGAMNPFADVADYFTVLGWASAMNPLLGTAAEQLGIRNGQLEAYPDLAYDPESGKLVVKQPNLFTSVITNTLPQAELLMYVAGANRDLRDRMRTDPDGAMRTILASGGVPMPWRRISIPQEVARHEINLSEARERAQAEALRTGDDTVADNFPDARAYLDNLRAFLAQNPELAAAFNPQAITAEQVPTDRTQLTVTQQLTRPVPSQLRRPTPPMAPIGG